MSNIIIFDYEKDIREIILNEFSQYLRGNAILQLKKGLSLSSLMLNFSNWKNRFITPKPRKIYISKELKANPIARNKQNILNEIIGELQTGKDINHRLSKKVYEHSYCFNSKSYTPDKDLLLNDWGIHHLHLNNRKKAGKNRGSGQLLFLKIYDSRAFLIDILDHKSSNFANSNLLKIIKSNWAELLEPYKLNGVKGLSHNCTNEEHFQLRKAGVSVLREVDGEFYCMGGISASGHDVNQLTKIDRFLLHLKNIKQSLELEENIQELKQQLEKRFEKQIDMLKLKVVLIEDTFLIAEENFNCSIDFNRD